MALNPPFEKLEQETELPFVAIFTVEMVLKILALGFIYERGSYLRSSWNWLDFGVVVSGLMTIYIRQAAGESGLDAIKAIRALRVLRPLRTVNRIPGMRVLVRALLDAIPAMGSVLVLCAFIFLVCCRSMHGRVGDGARMAGWGTVQAWQGGARWGYSSGVAGVGAAPCLSMSMSMSMSMARSTSYYAACTQRAVCALSAVLALACTRCPLLCAAHISLRAIAWRAVSSRQPQPS